MKVLKQESLKHYSDDIEFDKLKVKAKENIGYKQLVNNEGATIYESFRNYTIEIWRLLIEIHLKKMNLLMRGEFVLPKEHYSQEEIFKSQLENFINVDETIAVLNSFPIFIFDYYNYEDFVNKILGISKLQ